MIKKGIVSIVCCLLFISFLPVFVFADSSTYATFSDGCYFSDIYDTNRHTRLGFADSDNDIRAVRLYNNSRNGTIWFVSKSTFKTGDLNGTPSTNNSCGTIGSVSVKRTVGSLIYYTRTFNASYSVGENAWLSKYNVPSILVPDDFEIGNYNNYKTAYYYTFGEGATDPIEPINWGILRDVRYDTAVAGSGFSAFRNVDYIRWNNSIDANDNNISECQVEIQAVPGSWTGTSKEDLLVKGVDAFTIGGAYPAVTLGTVSAPVGTFSISWQGVVNKIGWPFDSLYAKLEGTQWLKNGWYYQIRLLGSDGYIGSWQTVYSLTSGSASGSENILTHNEFNSSTNTYLQTITQVNNQETVNITYNDTTITIENPAANPEPEGGTNLWDVLKQLVNGLFQLLAKLGDIAKAVINFVGDLLNGLLEFVQNLVTPPETISNEYNIEINNNVNNYIEQSQPGLNDTHEVIINAKDTLEGISSNAGNDCILTWEDVKLDLSVFGAGNVVFIPGGTYDFKASFNNLLAGAGLSYETYQMLVSAVIYICLIYLISRKITGFLHKS